MPDGLRTQLQLEGKLLSHDQRVRLMLARATLASPRVLLVDGILDHLSDESRRELEGFLCGPEVPWTCLISTARSGLFTPLHEVRIGAEKHS